MATIDWLRFQPDEEAKVLYVEILMSRLLELQPNTNEATDEFCEAFYPVLDQIQELCLTRGLKQSCSANMEGVSVRRIKPTIIMRMIWNVYDHTKDCILLQNCQVSGGGTFVNTLVGAVKGLLPPFMRNMITLIPRQNQDDESDDDDEDVSEASSEESNEII
jgi:hypothetical protein